MKSPAPILLLCIYLGLPCGCRQDNLPYVNLFMGTSGDHGQVTPAAAVPFGLVSVCPDSDPPQHGGYDFAVPVISGISVNRITGVGCNGVGGNLRIRPGSAEQSIEIIKGSETASPGYYSAALSNGVKVELAATRSTALERFNLKDADSEGRTFVLDAASSMDPRKVSCSYAVMDNHTVEGWVISPTACARGTYKLWFCMHSSLPFQVAGEDASTLSMHFPDGKRNLEIRIGTSTVDLAAARDALKSCRSKSFMHIRRQARNEWRSKLGKIKVSGGTTEQKRIFYTSMYRVYNSPMLISSADGRYFGTDNRIHEPDGRRHYGSWSMWDSFRTKFPMLEILEPAEMTHICNSLVDLYRDGKRNWAMPHETAPTVRTEHSIITLLDAAVKGVEGLDLAPGYEGMLKEARKDLPMKGLDQRLESSYDLWALSQVAAMLGHDEDAVNFRCKADSLFEATWTEHFMEIEPDFDVMRDNGLYQGSKWQHRWNAPAYLDKMVALAGADTLADQLERFFRLGLYNQGNEPDIHTPFLFNTFGRPDKTQDVVRAYLNDDTMVHIYGGNAEYDEPYVGRAFKDDVEGYAPEMDEDDGTMSAWYMFASMGFYPVTPGTDVYELFSPVFDRISIRQGRGRTFKIETQGRQTPSDHVLSYKLDGKTLEGTRLHHDAIRSGKKLTVNYN